MTFKLKLSLPKVDFQRYLGPGISILVLLAFMYVAFLIRGSQNPQADPVYLKQQIDKFDQTKIQIKTAQLNALGKTPASVSPGRNPFKP